MDPPPDPPEGPVPNNDPSGLTITTLQQNNNNNNNNTSHSEAEAAVSHTCVYEARRPLRLQQYEDGISNVGYFLVDESSDRAQQLAAFLRHHLFTITVHRHIPSVAAFLVHHPGVVVTVDTDIPDHVFDQGLQVLLAAQTPNSSGNTAFFSPASGMSSSPDVQASPPSQGFSFGGWSSSASQGRAPSEPPSSMFANTSEIGEAVPPAVTPLGL